MLANFYMQNVLIALFTHILLILRTWFLLAVMSCTCHLHIFSNYTFSTTTIFLLTHFFKQTLLALSFFYSHFSCMYFYMCIFYLHIFTNSFLLVYFYSILFHSAICLLAQFFTWSYFYLQVRPQKVSIKKWEIENISRNPTSDKYKKETKKSSLHLFLKIMTAEQKE